MRAGSLVLLMALVLVFGLTWFVVSEMTAPPEPDLVIENESSSLIVVRSFSWGDGPTPASERQVIEPGGRAEIITCGFPLEHDLVFEDDEPTGIAVSCPSESPVIVDDAQLRAAAAG